MSFKSTYALFSELDAVNLCLRAMGEAEASSLTDSQDDEYVGHALSTLDATDLEVQSKGYAFNTDFDWKFSPAADGTIALPSQTLRVANAYFSTSPSSGVPPLITERGGLLYDRTNKTTVFTADIYLDVTQRLEYTDLPQPARDYIAKKAAYLCQAFKQSDRLAARVTENEVQVSLAALEQYDDNQNPKNSIQGNLTVAQRLWGAVRRSRS